MVLDVLYGSIGVPEKLKDIVNSWYFQRTGEITVQPFPDPFFSNASLNTEKEHALGVMHLANLACDLHKELKPFRNLLTISALVHYMIEFPISGPFERALAKIGKDDVGKRIMSLMNSTEVGEVVRRLGVNLEDIISINTDSYKDFPAVNALFNSVVGLKKIDYLPRDGHHIGIEPGRKLVDHLALLAMMGFSDLTQINIRPEGVAAFENLISAYNIMFTEVYLGPQKHVLNDMFEKAVILAVDSSILDLQDVLESSSFGIEFFDWTDRNIFDHLLAYVMDRSDHPDAEHLGILLKAIKGRVLYRKILDYPVKDKTTLSEKLLTYKGISELEGIIASACGLNGTIDVIVSCPNTTLRDQLLKPTNGVIQVCGVPLFQVSEKVGHREVPSLSINKLIDTWQTLQVAHVYIRSIPGLDFSKIMNACRDILENFQKVRPDYDDTK